MDGALFGTETEYACAGSLSPTEAAMRVKDGIFAGRQFGHTYGYHENYCLRVSPRSRDMVQGLLPFLVTRQIFAGAGMISPASIRPRSTPRAGGPSALLALPDSRPRASAPAPS